MKITQLILLSILRYSFFILTFPLIGIAVVIDSLLYLLTFRVLETKITKNLTSFCIFVNKVLLKKEFKVIFKK